MLAITFDESPSVTLTYDLQTGSHCLFSLSYLAYTLQTQLKDPFESATRVKILLLGSDSPCRTWALRTLPEWTQSLHHPWLMSFNFDNEEAEDLVAMIGSAWQLAD